MRNRSRYDRSRDFDGREDRDHDGRDESRYAGRAQRDDRYSRWRGSRCFGDDLGDYPGSYARPGWGSGYDDVGGTSWERRGRIGEEDEDRSDYRHWREERMKKFDADYGEWRKERRRKFSEEFDRWRSSRPPSGAEPTKE